MGSPTISPASTLHQRTRALKLANDVRRRRRELRDKIRRLEPHDGARLAARVLLHPPAYARTMTVTRLLTAVHGYGKSRAKEVAGRRAFDRQLGRLSEGERARIAKECCARAAHRKRVRMAAHPDREQAMRSIADANRVRLARSGALRAIADAPNRANAAFRAAGLITSTTRESDLDGLTVKAVLEAIPGIQTFKARQLLGPLKINDGATLGMLSRPRAASIASALIERYGQGYQPLQAITEQTVAAEEPERLAA
jgi:ribosomal protein S13